MVLGAADDDSLMRLAQQSPAPDSPSSRDFDDDSKDSFDSQLTLNEDPNIQGPKSNTYGLVHRLLQRMGRVAPTSH
eukprot:8321461-Karenia_brevis.AAC.1